MKRLTRYLLRETSLTFGFVFLSIVVVFTFGAVARALHLLQGMPLVFVGDFLLNTLGYMSPFLFPVSLLVAVLLTYGRFAADNETVAVQAAGLRPAGLMRPAIYLAIPFALACFLALDWLQPQFHLLYRRVQRDAISLVLQKFGSTQREATIGIYRMSWAHSEPTPDGGMRFENVVLYEVDRNGEIVQKLTARSATLTLGKEKLRLKLRDTNLLLDRRDPDRRSARRPQETPRDGGTLDARDEGERVETGDLFSLEVEEGELAYAYDALLGLDRKALTEKDKRLQELVVVRQADVPPFPRPVIDTEIHSRFALAAASLVFALVGAPLGLLLRRGSRLTAFFVAICIIGFYYVLFHFAEEFGKEGRIPAQLVWTPDALLLIAGLVGIWMLERSR